LSKDESNSGKHWKDELARYRSRNVQITTSGGTYAGSLTLTKDRGIVRLAPNASGLLPATIAVRKIINISDLSSLSLAEYAIFVAGTDLNNSL
jgi:hypothetical protein